MVSHSVVKPTFEIYKLDYPVVAATRVYADMKLVMPDKLKDEH